MMGRDMRQHMGWTLLGLIDNLEYTSSAMTRVTLRQDTTEQLVMCTKCESCNVQEEAYE